MYCKMKLDNFSYHTEKEVFSICDYKLHDKIIMVKALLL